MTRSHFTCLALALMGGVPSVSAQAPEAPQMTGGHAYTVFVQSRAIGREEVSVTRDGENWLVRGTSRLAAPLDVTTHRAEIRYDAAWRPVSLVLDATVRGQVVSLQTSFTDGTASNRMQVGDAEPATKDDPVAADAVVLPNQFLGSYAALAHRLAGAQQDAAFSGYVPPQGAIPIVVEGVFDERIETPRAALDAKRYALRIDNPAPAGALRLSLWADADGDLLRLSVPAQALEVARDDVASAASRTAAFSLPGDESVLIPAQGFNLAASVTKPSGATGKLPALVLVGGSGPTGRDGVAFGIPVLGQMAKAFVEAGFLVVRYDKRGVGQSGGRTESATLQDYAEDVRAILRWLEREHKDDVDKDRIGLVGHSEGAWVAMIAAERDKRVAALALVAGAAIPGNELILEQQRHALDLMNAPIEERNAKIALQEKLQQAVLGEGSWDGVPDELRRRSDNPWFQSFLAFHPADVMEDIDQPVLVVQGSVDTQVPPYHAEKLAGLARARKRKVDTDLAVVPGVNHLLVPATTGEVSEYSSLTDREVANGVTAAISTWMARELGEGRK
ncbi:MAG: alpha/beta hydrolase family protein [Vicinamibacterales bacterium]